MLYLARKLTDNQETLKTIYYSLVQPYFDYCDVVWGDCSKTRADKLQKSQNRAARIITRADYSIRSSDVLNSLEWSNLEERRKRHLLVRMFKVFNNNCPTYLRERFNRTSEILDYNLRVLTMISNYHYLKQIFLSVHFLIGLQWLGTNCQIKHVRYGNLLALNSRYPRI